MCPIRLLILGLLWSEGSCFGGAMKMKELQEALFRNYSSSVLPKKNYSEPIKVTVQLYLNTVMELNTKEQTMSLKAFTRVFWTDELIQWKPEDYGNISLILIPQDNLWKPDILLVNSANDLSYIGDSKVLMAISADGRVAWDFQFQLTSTCKLDVSKYPFDENICPIIIASWTHNNRSVNLTWPDKAINMDRMITNGEFEITAGDMVKRSDKYDGEFFDIIIFHLKLKRRPAHVVFSLLVPVTLLAVLSVLSFTLAPDQTEKLTLSITCLLSFTVFLDVIDNNMPQTSDNISLLVVYVTILLVLSFLGVVGNILILNLNRCELEGRRRKRTVYLDNESEYLNKRMNDQMPTSDNKARRMHTRADLLCSHCFSDTQTLNANQSDHDLEGESGLFAQRLNRMLLVANCLVLATIIVVIGALIML